MPEGFANAVKNALEFYADSLGVSIEKAKDYYRRYESTRECIALLVIAQAKKK